MSSEIFPFAKSGGLADVVYSLARAVNSVEVAEAVMPLYSFIDRGSYSIESAHRDFSVELPSGIYPFEVYYTVMDGVRFWFLYNSVLCDRDYMYGTSEGAYPDNDLRFGLFDYGVVKWLLEFHNGVDVVHLNDWQTALVALLAREHFGAGFKLVFTIHNLAYQGIFPKDTMYRLGLDWRYFTLDRIEFYDQVNMLKAGVSYSDVVTVVSPSYAKEIMSPEFGCGLDGFMRSYEYKVVGIMNGIDYGIFSPEADELIPRTYSRRDFVSGKAFNKEELMKKLELEGKDKPLLIFIGRFTYQKGVDLLLGATRSISDMNVNMVVLGSGEKRYADAFSNLRCSNIACVVGYDEELAHLMYAAGDVLLMPSLFEPCGLNQLIAAKYGVLPVVRGVGGLKDSVVDFMDFSGAEQKSIGVVFTAADAEGLCAGVCRALSILSDKDYRRWAVKYNMSLDFSWHVSAKEYIKLYRELIEGERDGR